MTDRIHGVAQNWLVQGTRTHLTDKDIRCMKIMEAIDRMQSADDEELKGMSRLALLAFLVSIVALILSIVFAP